MSDDFDDFDDTADKLYGDDVPSATQKPAPPPASAGATDDRETAHQLYGYSALESAIDQRGEELWSVTGATEAMQRQTRDQFVGIATATGLPEMLVARIAEHYLDAELATFRQDDPEAAELALARQIDEWNAELRTDLRARYGAVDAEKLLIRAEKFVKSHPALNGILKQHGLGSRPDLVDGIISHVFSTGYR